MGYYHTAQICINGHLISQKFNPNSNSSQNYCIKCGSEAICQCPHCEAFICGKYHVDVVLDLTGKVIDIPQFCYNCGKPYPWTADQLYATRELLNLENNLSADEKEYLSSNLESLLVDTPKTKLVATKFKLALSKLGTITATTLKEIIVDIGSETAKKIITGS